MSPTIYCAVRVMGRPRETQVTLTTLAGTFGLDRVDVQILFSPTPELSVEQIRAWTKPNWTVVELSPLKWHESVLGAYKAFLRGDWSWFCWIENDNILNPDWLDIMLEFHAEASKLRKVGFMALQRLKGKAYVDEDPGPEYGFLFRDHVQFTAYLAIRDLIERVDLGMFLNPRAYHEGLLMAAANKQGYKQLVPKCSISQHIGRTGTTQNEKKWIAAGRGGINFIPHQSVWNWWREFNSDLEILKPNEP